MKGGRGARKGVGVSARFDEIAVMMRELDDETRLAMLLDYSRKLPELPGELAEKWARGEGRAPECVTPVFLEMERGESGRVTLHVAVGEEAPTVRGVLAIVVEGFSGRAAGEVAEMPEDLLGRLGLTRQIRMQRATGIAGIVGRIRRMARELHSAV